MESVVTLTLNPALDKSTSIDYVTPERKLRCAAPQYEPGGGGINVSRAIVKLGGRSSAIFFSGGPAGMRIEQSLRDEGIDVHPIGINEWTRENFAVREDATTLQYRFGLPGPAITDAEWKRLVTTIGSLDPAPTFFVVSGSLPPNVEIESYAEIVQLAGECGARVIVDTSGRALRAAARTGVYLLKPNLQELASLEGERWIEDEEHLRTAAKRLVDDRHSEVVIVSLGRAGALVTTAEEQIRIHAPAVPVQSKIGAGDSMVAGIVHGLISGRSVLEAASYGVAAGSAAVMSPGTELCRREDVERLYQQNRQSTQRESDDVLTVPSP